MDFPSSFFQIGPYPKDALEGHYIYSLVILSYFLAVLGSYVALEMAEKLRNRDYALRSKLVFLIGGALSMGLGIWTMHFIGMEAFDMNMPMYYDTYKTIISFIFAALGSGIAFFVIRNRIISYHRFVIGGICIAIAIVMMHYMGMAAMLHMKIHYVPSLFALSILIAVLASLGALGLMLKSSHLNSRYSQLLKILSALVMGLAICGMHYMGMYAAVFTPGQEHHVTDQHEISSTVLDPYTLSMILAATIMSIMLFAYVSSRIWVNAIKKNEQRIRDILAAAADGIIVTDEEGRIELANKSIKQMMGFDESEVLHKHITHYIGVLDPTTNQFKRTRFRELIAHSGELFEFTGLGKNKELVPIELTVASTVINGTKAYIFGTHDITRRKKAAEEVRLLNNQLVEAARKAGIAEVAVGVLHNVGNVLNSVNVTSENLLLRSQHMSLDGLKKISELLEERKQDFNALFENEPKLQLIPAYLKEFIRHTEEETKFIDYELDNLSQKINHLKHIIKMQQLYSKTSGGFTENVDINQMINEAVMLYKNKIIKDQIKIIKDYADLPFLKMDKTKIMQIVLNLIKNAVESVLERGEPSKEVILRTSSDDDFVHIEVIDNGVGFDKDDTTKLFSYGFTTKSEGHGYGLHTSALAAQQEGGSLTAYSDGPQMGATFVLTLPKILNKVNV